MLIEYELISDISGNIMIDISYKIIGKHLHNKRKKAP